MKLGEAMRRLRELHVIEEKLLDMLIDEQADYHIDDVKAITSKIFEVVGIISQLTDLIIECKKRGAKGYE
jgi:hypothetical protein